MPRRPLDFYETPPHYIAALLHYTQIFGKVYEPCAGKGAIVNVLRARDLSVISNDIDLKLQADYHYDATREIPAGLGFDWIVTNPPFADAFEILEMCFPNAPNLAFLARLSFLEPTEERTHFFQEHPPNQVIVLPRYSFRLNDDGKRQTDNVTCCWLVWKEMPMPWGISIVGRGKAQSLAILQGLA